MKPIDPQEQLGNAYLRERGVLEPTFLAHGGEIRPMEIGTVSKRLNRNFTRVRFDEAWQTVESILWFPIFGSNGQHHWLARPLPYYKKAKFLAANHSASMPWIPPATRDVAKDVGVPIVFTEGPVKGMVLCQAGAFPIALIGVWPLASKKSGRRDRRYLPPELARNFEWLRRRVYVCFDADKLKKRGVRHAEIRLCFLLHSAGAEVFVLSWPLAEGKGIDDYLAGKGGTDTEKQRAALQKLIGDAKPFLETLERADIVAAKRELHRTQPDRARFDQLAKLIYKPLGLSAKSSLGKFQGGDTQRDEPNGAKPVEIPPTAKPWWDGELTAREVLDEICEAEKRFVCMKPSQRRAVALWIVLTYLHDAVDILPILLISSPEEECGKSTLLKLILYLSNRPVRAGNISAAAIYRTIKDICPTMCLDEAETYLKDNEEMRGVIDSGHEREFAWVIRTAMEGEETVQFSTWCPKALAQIGLPKRTILSRSIHIRLSRKLKDDKTEKLRKKHYQEFENLRRKISGLADDIRDHVKAFEDDTLENRAGDNWQPLFAIASAAGEEWLKKTTLAAQQIHRKDKQEMKKLWALPARISRPHY